jgi:hypothetical protein
MTAGEDGERRSTQVSENDLMDGAATFCETNPPHARAAREQLQPARVMGDVPGGIHTQPAFSSRDAKHEVNRRPPNLAGNEFPRPLPRLLVEVVQVFADDVATVVPAEFEAEILRLSGGIANEKVRAKAVDSNARPLGILEPRGNPPAVIREYGDPSLPRRV